MRYIRQHIQQIIQSYTGSVPLTHYLKQYYKRFPKLGSRDRKTISEMAYSWYRCAKGWANDMAFDDKLNACLFLCSTQEKLVKPFLPTDWPFEASATVKARLSFLSSIQITFDINKLFPFHHQLSEGIDKEEWLYAILRQPDLFIRIRKEKDRIISILTEANIPFTDLSNHCIALPNSTDIEKLLKNDSYVVQDASSQQTGNYFKPKAGEKWLDCCSGAGGKSLLLKDMESKVQLTVSDKRASILHNLEDRFKLYHHTQPASYILDVANTKELRERLSGQQFDNIICDVPCSGSGTWARTPEQLYFFDPAKLEPLIELQQKITSNISGFLKENGRMIYITCSIFKAENEQIVNAMLSNTKLSLQESILINGIARKADSMFVSVLQWQN